MIPGAWEKAEKLRVKKDHAIKTAKYRTLHPKPKKKGRNTLFEEEQLKEIVEAAW